MDNYKLMALAVGTSSLALGVIRLIVGKHHAAELSRPKKVWIVLMLVVFVAAVVLGSFTW